MDIIYENSKGQRLNLSQYPYWLNTMPLFNNEWAYSSIETSKNNRIVSFKKNIREIPLQLNIHAKSDKVWKSAMERFFEVTETDVIALTPGRLILPDEEFLYCYLTESDQYLRNTRIKANSRMIKLTSENPFWTREIVKEFYSEDTPSDYEYAKKYDYDYNYDYLASGTTTSQITNTSIAPADFRLIINGSAPNPIVIDIGENRYALNMELLSNEYVVIDSRKKTIEYTNVVGEKTNAFAARDIYSYIFEKVAPGINVVSWTGDFSFELTLYAERSEPIWT